MQSRPPYLDGSGDGLKDFTVSWQPAAQQPHPGVSATLLFESGRRDSPRQQVPASSSVQEQIQSPEAAQKWEELIKSVNFTNQGDFREGAVLGNGAFGLVSKIMHRKSRLLFASKSMVLSPTPGVIVANQLAIAEAFLQEIQGHQRVKHPNIVRCFGGWTQQTGTDEGHYNAERGEFVCKFSIILEFMGGGTLSDVVLKRESPSTSVELHRWIFQITLGLREIHRKGFTHFDLKPDNVLLTTKLNAKIADLGGMAPAGHQQIMTPAFAAPETEGAGPAYDMFALGLIIVCCSLRMTGISCDPIAPENKRISVAKKLQLQPAFDLKKEPRLETFFQKKSVASEIVEKLILVDPTLRLSDDECLTEMSTVAPEQFTLAHEDLEVIRDPRRHEQSELLKEVYRLESLYSDDGFDAIMEPADPRSRIRIFTFSMFLLAAFVAVLTQCSIALSSAEIPPAGNVRTNISSSSIFTSAYSSPPSASKSSSSTSSRAEKTSSVAAYLAIAIVLSICFGVFAGSFLLLYIMKLGKSSIYVSFFLVYIADVILSIALATTFDKKGEDVRLALALIYAISKIITAYIPLQYINLTWHLICIIIDSVQFLFKGDFRLVWAVVCLSLALQICVLFLGLPYVIEPWSLPPETAGNVIFAAFVNVYVFLWLLNLPRYCLHYLCVSLYRNSFSQIKSTRPLLNAAYDCVLEHGLGILVVSGFSILSPVCSFTVSVLTSLTWTSGAVAVGCGACATESDADDNKCEWLCALTALCSAAVAAVSFFLIKLAKGLLTYVTKLNLTTMIILKLGYWKACKQTAWNKKIEKLASGNASLVTENIVSAHISNICLLIGGLMFVILDRLMPAAAFNALITGYVIARTMFEPVDAWVLTAYAVFDYMPELLPALTGSLKLQEEFEAIRKKTQENDTTDETAVVQMHLRLDMDFQAAGQEGSAQRQIFIKDLKNDLANAAAAPAPDFNILQVSTGSILVDMHAPEKAAQEIQRQSLDANSRLRSGKITRFTESITLQVRQVQTPWESGVSQGQDRDRATAAMRGSIDA